MLLTGTPILAVKSGTTLRDDKTGEIATVDDNTAVMKDGSIYVTKACFDLIVAAVPTKTLQ